MADREVIFLTDEWSFEAVVGDGWDMTEADAASYLAAEGIPLDGPLRRQAFLEAGATGTDWDRYFERVADGTPGAVYGWVCE